MDEYLVQAWNSQLPLLIGIAAILGLGKGGVPGLATIATALTVLTAPAAGMGYAVALQVPVLTMIDVAAAWMHKKSLDWTVVKILLPFSYAGMAAGQVLDQILSEGASRLLVGSLLLFVLAMRVYVDYVLSPESTTIMSRKDSDPTNEERHALELSVKNDINRNHHLHHFYRDGDGDDEAPAVDEQVILVPQSTTSSSSSSSSSSRKNNNNNNSSSSSSVSIKWAAATGLIGGASTILTNSMGPILNVYLLAIARLNPVAYIGTRAMFFCLVNVGKLPLRVAAGTLGWPMVPLAVLLGGVSVVGVWCAKPIMLAMHESTFVRLELAVVAIAGVRLCWTGLAQGL